jgi:hypothetical protein
VIQAKPHRSIPRYVSDHMEVELVARADIPGSGEAADPGKLAVQAGDVSPLRTNVQVGSQSSE